MIAKLFISPYGSLNFNNNWRQHDQQDTDYEQKFIVGDSVIVQYVIPYGNDKSWADINIRHYNAVTGERIPVASSQLLLQTESQLFYNATLDTTEAGCFRVAFERLNMDATTTVLKESFYTVLPELPAEGGEQLMLFRYTNTSDKDSTLFASDFYFRCEATFFPQSEIYNAEANEFRDQNFDLSMLSAEASTSRGLTVGGYLGVPSWVAEKINHIFSCTEVYLGETGEEVQYVKSSDGEVSRTTMGDMYPRYMFVINLEASITEANSVKLGAYTPDGIFEIDPDWLEVSPDGIVTYIQVTAPDNNWAVSAPSNGWLQAYKLSDICYVSVPQNTSTAERSANITFSWTDPDTGDTITRTATVTQVAVGEDIEHIHFSGQAFDAATGVPTPALWGLFVDDVQIAFRITDASGKFSYDWPVTQAQYSAVQSIRIHVAGGLYVSQDVYLSSIPTFSTAVVNGIAFPPVQLVKQP